MTPTRIQRESPILFSGAMVRAILDGRKTMTRRVLKLQPIYAFDAIFCEDDGTWNTGDALTGQRFEKLPVKYTVGNYLWVREAWRTHGTYDRLKPSDVPVDAPISYEASRADGDFFGKLRPSMFMCRWMNRITLEVTAVKVERLQDISEEDAKSEGIYWSELFSGWTSGAGPDESCDYHSGRAAVAFFKLWERINGDGSRKANPWVVAYNFKVVE
jgi:hypothetical protein